MRTGISLGSNMGNRLRHLQQAQAAISALHSPVLCSKVYETDPVGCEPGTAPYLNAVIEFECDRQPELLLEELHQIEIDMGRPSRHPRNAPRPIDLDILYAGNLAVNEGNLVIPHPRLGERRFVLAPLCDIRPGLILPGFRETVAQLLAKLPQEPRVMAFPGSIT